MSSSSAVSMKGVWKKYSRDVMFHRSLREDIVNLFSSRRNKQLGASDFWALQDFSLQVYPGEAIGLYGHNGAGKSTVLKLLSGVTEQTTGTIDINGRIAPLIEVGAGFHPDLTGRENVFINGAILGMRLSQIRDRFDSIVKFSELGDFIDMPVKKYSSGMYIRLAFSVAIHSDADVFLIDEVLAVGDVDFQTKCLDRVRGLIRKGKALVLVSHNLNLLKSVSSEVVFLEKGRVVSSTKHSKIVYAAKERTFDCRGKINV